MERETDTCRLRGLQSARAFSLLPYARERKTSASGNQGHSRQKAETKDHLPEESLRKLQDFVDGGRKRLTAAGIARVGKWRAQGTSDVRALAGMLLAEDAGAVKLLETRNVKTTHAYIEKHLRRSDPLDPEILSEMIVVPLSALRVGVAKYDVVLREASLQAMRAITLRRCRPNLDCSVKVFKRLDSREPGD